MNPPRDTLVKGLRPNVQQTVSPQSASPDSSRPQSLYGGEASHKTLTKMPELESGDSPSIKYRIEYTGQKSGSVFVEGKSKARDLSQEPVVFEYVDVRLSARDVLSNDIADIASTDKGKGHSYINIISPAVSEALRCVVDYFPGLDLSENIVKIYEPYSVFFFYEEELTAYRKRLSESAHERAPDCPNQWADKHIGIIQEFVKDKYQEAVDAERKRQARGYVTFDMLWLLYKPGTDVYFDYSAVDEHNPYVFESLRFNLVNGSTSMYELICWNLDGSESYVGPTRCWRSIPRFAGEKAIDSLEIYPCSYLGVSDSIEPDEIAKIEQHFVDRGRKWFQMRRQPRPYYFDGLTYTFPRRTYTSLIIVDPVMYKEWEDRDKASLTRVIDHPPGPFQICPCERCEREIYEHASKPKFAGYTDINPFIADSLTDHQYFLCDQAIEAFVFKTRSWKILQVDDVQEPVFDKTLFERMVMKPSTKELIRNLAQTYMRDSDPSFKRDVSRYINIKTIHKRKKTTVDSTWSADAIEGKGEGLTMLLHGRPGVGKTYTAECISDFLGRPLLSLTCTDIGVKPEVIETNLRRWFNLAETWGAIMLLDEADIYMEERQVQDVERNHLVAGFLRALEYYKGILFLTTNRVGTFDEAFISRVHVQIHYPGFDDDERERLWDTMFQKLEEERETTMHIKPATKDYVQTKEVRDLNWNGREIRNAFQVAVALAQAQNEKDKMGRISIKPEHIRASVHMSREFTEYLDKVHKGNLSKKASIQGTRYDAYGKETEKSGKY